MPARTRMLHPELRFQVPLAARLAIAKAMKARSERSQVQAHYFDTPAFDLAAAGLVLRLRLEGRKRVQTLKVAHAGGWHRTEHDVHLAAPGLPIGVDVALHAGTPEGDAVKKVLGKSGARALAPRFVVSVERTFRLARSAGAQVDLWLDVGELKCGEHRLPLFELCMRSTDGTIDPVLRLARTWVRRHGLWLESRSLAQRGKLLCQGPDATCPAGASVPALEPQHSPDQALRAMVLCAVCRVLPEAAVIATDGGRPEQLHRVRTELRRLRTVLKVFGHASPQASGAWHAGLSGLFERLGHARDQDVFETVWRPRLAAVGARPEWPIERSNEHEPAEILRGTPATSLWLDLLGFGLDESTASATDDPSSTGHQDPRGVDGKPLAKFIEPCLRRLERQVLRDAGRWMALNDDERHRLRRRMKRLGDAVEATQSLWPARPTQRWLSILQEVQQALGAHCDLQAALELLRLEARHDASAWFAMGWLTAQQPALLATADVMLKQWLQAPRLSHVLRR